MRCERQFVERALHYAAQAVAAVGACAPPLNAIALGVSESDEGVAVNQQSIEAYDLPQRVASYDTDMELMHPNRSKMVRAALQILPFDGTAPLWALDLGVGTG